MPWGLPSGGNLRGGRNFCAGKSLPASAGKIPENQISGECSQSQQQQAPTPLPKDQLSDAEQAAVNQDHSHQPVERVAAQILNFGEFGDKASDAPPAVNCGVHAPVERDQGLVGFGGSEEGCEEPGEGGDPASNQTLFCVHQRVVADERNLIQPNGHCGSCDHRRNFTPCVYAGPVPAQNVNCSSAEADAQHQTPSLA